MKLVLITWKKLGLICLSFLHEKVQKCYLVNILLSLFLGKWYHYLPRIQSSSCCSVCKSLICNCYVTDVFAIYLKHSSIVTNFVPVNEMFLYAELYSACYIFLQCASWNPERLRFMLFFQKVFFWNLN